MKLNTIQSVNIPSLGRLPLSEQGSTLEIGGTLRTYRYGVAEGDGGFVEQRVPSKLSLQVNAVKGLGFQDFEKLSSENITITLSDGSVYMMPEAWCDGQVKLSGAEVQVSFSSVNCEKIS